MPALHSLAPLYTRRAATHTPDMAHLNGVLCSSHVNRSGAHLVRMRQLLLQQRQSFRLLRLKPQPLRQLQQQHRARSFLQPDNA